VLAVPNGGLTHHHGGLRSAPLPVLLQQLLSAAALAHATSEDTLYKHFPAKRAWKGSCGRDALSPGAVSQALPPWEVLGLPELGLTFPSLSWACASGSRLRECLSRPAGARTFPRTDTLSMAAARAWRARSFWHRSVPCSAVVVRFLVSPCAGRFGVLPSVSRCEVVAPWLVALVRAPALCYLFLGVRGASRSRRRTRLILAAPPPHSGGASSFTQTGDSEAFAGG